MALTRILRNLSVRMDCRSVRSQSKGMMVLTPISVAFSRNHSKRAVCLTGEIAIVTRFVRGGSVKAAFMETRHFF